MQPLERPRILGRSDGSGRYRLEVGPKRDDEAVTSVDGRLDPWLKWSNRATGFGEPPSDLDFELCACLVRYVRDPNKNVTRQQARNDAVRFMKNDRVIDPQVKR